MMSKLKNEDIAALVGARAKYETEYMLSRDENISDIANWDHVLQRDGTSRTRYLLDLNGAGKTYWGENELSKLDLHAIRKELNENNKNQENVIQNEIKTVRKCYERALSKRALSKVGTRGKKADKLSLDIVNAFEALRELDVKLIGTKFYQGIAYFWGYAYKYYLRDTSNIKRLLVHERFLKAGLEPGGESDAHEKIIIETTGTKSCMERLIKTNNYIKTITARDRMDHHNYVVECEVINLNTPLAEMNKAAVAKFDTELVEVLKQLRR